MCLLAMKKSPSLVLGFVRYRKMEKSSFRIKGCYNLPICFSQILRFMQKLIYLVSNVKIHTDFVGKFSTRYGGRPCRRFSNLCFGATLPFKLIARF